MKIQRVTRWGVIYTFDESTIRKSVGSVPKKLLIFRVRNHLNKGASGGILDDQQIVPIFVDGGEETRMHLIAIEKGIPDAKTIRYRRKIGRAHV